MLIGFESTVAWPEALLRSAIHVTARTARHIKTANHASSFHHSERRNERLTKRSIQTCAPGSRAKTRMQLNIVGSPRRCTASLAPPSLLLTRSGKEILWGKRRSAVRNKARQVKDWRSVPECDSSRTALRYAGDYIELRLDCPVYADLRRVAVRAAFVLGGYKVKVQIESVLLTTRRSGSEIKLFLAVGV